MSRGSRQELSNDASSGESGDWSSAKEECWTKLEDVWRLRHPLSLTACHPGVCSRARPSAGFFSFEILRIQRGFRILFGWHNRHIFSGLTRPKRLTTG